MHNVCCHTDIDNRLENTLQQKEKTNANKEIRYGTLTAPYIFPPPYQS